MVFLKNFFCLIINELGFLSWRDPLEIGLLAVGIYYFLRWLSQDTEKNAIVWFYGYSILFFGAYYVQLQTVSLFLIITVPVVGLFFIIIHQHMLQKNFITMTRRAVSIADHTSDWLHTFISACLYGLNKHKDVVWILERADMLDVFLTSGSLVKAPLTGPIIELILSSENNNLKNNSMILIDRDGRLVAYDVSWVARGTDWKHDALLMSSKTDAIIIKASLSTRLFDIILFGISIERLSVGEVYDLLKYCTKKGVREEVMHYVDSHYKNYKNQEFFIA
ncbi:MAG: hypothetical protein WC707_00235 [Candidatus Babeliaceae bacterium]